MILPWALRHVNVRTVAIYEVHSVNVFKYKFQFARNLLAAIILEFANLVANQFGSFSARNVKKNVYFAN